MFPLAIWLRRLGFWIGPVLLGASLLLAYPLLIGAAYFPPLALLLLLPAGGLLLGVKLILWGAQPAWAKVLAILSPGLGPGLCFLVWGALLPASERVTFLLPAGFRGEVTLIHGASYGQPLPRTNGNLLLTVPATGLLTTSDELKPAWLTEADYYFIDATGQRLAALPHLNEATFDASTQPGQQLADKRREVGVFAAEGLQYKPSEFAKDYPNVPGDTHTPGVAYLTFTVACYDSLAGLMRRPPF